MNGRNNQQMSAPGTATIEIIPYDPTWPEQFKQVAATIRTALGDLAHSIDHIGSTSVPGLAAKDVIDVQVTVAKLEPELIVAALASLGYVHLNWISSDHVPPSYDATPDEWRKLIFRERPGQRRVNLHVREAGRTNQRYALLFRDYLRADPMAAGSYAQIKHALARLHPADVDAYYDVKDPVCDIIMAAAEQWVLRLNRPNS
jgi:GrpB-like predicted nucleotidyltransferase (UPF0157 family)